ncbi:MAG: ABC transporter substrate-binding protein [Chloroflexi bacterium]|nr:ABC transporter substrate-binding protein [Chloroflexota bacterium]
MRKLYSLLGLLIVISMVLTACATPTPVGETVVATEAPVVEVSLNPYLGSNKLDGNGAPTDFFSDVHIRKAFGYCFNWDTLVTQVYKGEAVQSKGLSLPGMVGFDANTPTYAFDLAKCEEEFKLADVDKDGIAAGDETDGSDVWNMGFRMQVLYNTGNTTRNTAASILQSNLAKVNPKFVLEILGIPWASVLRAYRAGKVPVTFIGWLEDIHDPYNWYQPYTVGTYGNSQSFPEELKTELKAKLAEALNAADPVARAEVYKQLNQLYYDQALGLPVVLQTSHAYEQKWVEGVVRNPIFSNFYYKTISKATGATNPTGFVMATPGDIDTLDPALSYDTASGEIIQNVYETLIFYDGEATDKFIPQLATEVPTAENGGISADGLTYTFKIRPDVKFHNGDVLTATDVAYSFQRGLLQGGYNSPQLLLAEPFLGVGNDDITMIVDQGATADDREGLLKVDPAVLKTACEKVQSVIVADDAAGTVTMTLAQPWSPFLATIANGWGSVMDKKWVIDNSGWDGTCDTWQNFYAMSSDEDPFTPIENGTGPFLLENRTPGEQIVMAKFADYWGEPAKLDTVTIKIIAEFGTRFAMLQTGDADVIYVPVENRPQVDPMVSEMRVYNAATNSYDPVQTICAYDGAKLGVDLFTPCATDETSNLSGNLRLYIGRPGLQQDVVLFNFNIK